MVPEPATTTAAFAPLDTYAPMNGLNPRDFMFMSTRVARIEGAPARLFGYKHRDTRNYLWLDEMGRSAWTVGDWPKPVPPSTAIEHVTSLRHSWGDNCYAFAR